MTKSLGWFTAKELAGLPGMPGSDRAIQIRGKDSWEWRKRAGTKAIEYSLGSLPVETQEVLLTREVGSAQQSTDLLLVHSDSELTERDAKSPSRLNNKQRNVMLESAGIEGAAAVSSQIYQEFVSWGCLYR